MNNLSDNFKFLAGLAELFEARFIKPSWQKYPAHDSDSFDALALFLDGYAFERQGAKPDFKHAAVDVVDELRKQGQTLRNESISQKAWNMFSRDLENQGLNKAKNPLCPRGKSYTITYKRNGIVKSNTTKNPSIFEFIQENGNSEPINIVTWARKSIEKDQVEDCHSKLLRINGIGSKIASLFLRDVARSYGVFPSKDRNLLQPVDIWIQRISEHLLQILPNKLSKEKIAEWIVKQAIQSDVNPEAVNEGMWYFGSQIAGSKYRMSKALDDLAYAKALPDERIKAIRQEVSAWEQKQEVGDG